MLHFSSNCTDDLDRRLTSIAELPPDRTRTGRMPPERIFWRNYNSRRYLDTVVARTYVASLTKQAELQVKSFHDLFPSESILFYGS